MNTSAHVTFGATVVARRNRPWVTVAAFAGALAPDVSLYLLAGWALFVQGLLSEHVFGKLYSSEEWRAVFRVDRSILVWSLLPAAAFWTRLDLSVAFAGAALLHLTIELPLHAADAGPHFWPLTDWVFASPLSYWNRNLHAGFVGPVEETISAALAGVLMVRLRSHAARSAVATLEMLELGTNRFWRWLL